MMDIVLKDIITLKAAQLNEAGILAHEQRKKFNTESIRSKPEEIGPQVLTLQHLSPGFMVICGMMTISFVAFVAECTPRLLKNVKELWDFGIEILVLSYIVVKFIKIHKLF
jgi:hypothetical protein